MRFPLFAALLTLSTQAFAQETTDWEAFGYAEERVAERTFAVAYLFGPDSSADGDNDVLFDPDDDLKPTPTPVNADADDDPRDDVIYDPDQDLPPPVSPYTNDGWIELNSVTQTVTRAQAWTPELYVIVDALGGDASRELSVTYRGEVAFEDDPDTPVPVLEVQGELVGFDGGVFVDLGLQEAVDALER